MATPPTGNPEGRPSLYEPDMPDRLRKYTTDYEKYFDAMPSRAGFARFVGVCENTLANWAEKNPEFLRALEELKTEQHRVLLNKGLLQHFNATICKLVLSSNHGYKERSDTTSDDKALQPVVMNFSDVAPKQMKDEDPEKDDSDKPEPSTDPAVH